MKNKILIIIIVLLILANGILFKKSQNDSLNLMYDIDELSKLLSEIHPSNVMIDLRDREDYENGHISGFINLPSSDGVDVDNYLKDNELKNKYIYVMCYSGKRAAVTASLLHDLHYKHIIYITFGYDDYVQSQTGFTPEIGECDCLAD